MPNNYYIYNMEEKKRSERMKQFCVAKIPQPLDCEGNMKQFEGLENCWTCAAHVYENCSLNVLLDQETSYSHPKQKW